MKLKNKIFLLLLSVCATTFTSCSTDEEIPVPNVVRTGTFEVEDQVVRDSTITISNVNVTQQSWIVLRRDNGSGEPVDSQVISVPKLVQKGESSDVAIQLKEGVEINDGETLWAVLHEDTKNVGLYEFDGESGIDAPITNDAGEVVMDAFTVTTYFSSLDEDGDDLLDENEVRNTYVSDFDAWDTDDDGVLSSEEFYDVTFWNTDADDDDAISEAEWDLGYDSMFGGYVEDDFATFDADADGFLDDTEWDGIFADSAWFENYDADDDSFVADTEWDAGLFGDWDLDDDTFVDEDEFNNYVDYVSVW